MSWCQTLHLHIFLLFWIFMCSCLQSKAPYSLSSNGFSSVCSLAYLSPINIVEHNLMGNYFRLPFWQTGSPQLVQAQPWKCKYLWILLLTAPALLSTRCAAKLGWDSVQIMQLGRKIQVRQIAFSRKLPKENFLSVSCHYSWRSYLRPGK